MISRFLFFSKVTEFPPSPKLPVQFTKLNETTIQTSGDIIYMNASSIAVEKKGGKESLYVHFSQRLYSCSMADALPCLSSHLIVLITNLALRKAYCAKGCSSTSELWLPGGDSF